MVELTENEEIIDVAEAYHARGFMPAIDDFGAGYAGLGPPADLWPDI
ncbi:hypothetical protein [Sphingomonas sp. M1A8_2b]